MASALAADEPSSFRVALGAVNPNTRHPVVLAMTGSALDELLPGRIVMGLGTGLPLRLKQMGIPYEPAAALARVSTTFDELRALWAGERLPSATPGLPPIQPMFPPTHRIPLFLAAYRKELVALAGQKADGYLARPAESIPSLRGILARLDEAAIAAGRDPRSIERAGYLLSLVDETRREALNRAKREPFVIYMMSILGDISLRRAGFEGDLRDRIAAAWRAEDYHTAGNLIPDDLLDAFMLCGTREDVAQRAMAFHLEGGLELPLLQPVLQEDRQIDELVAAAALYARSAAPEQIGARFKATLPPTTPAVDIGAVLADHQRAKESRAAGGTQTGARATIAASDAALPPAISTSSDAIALEAGSAEAGTSPAGGLADDRTLGRGSLAAPSGRCALGRSCGRSRTPRRSFPSSPGRACGRRRPLRMAAVPRRPRRSGAAPLRDEHRQRGLRRPPGHRHDHLAARQPRPAEGSADRTGGPRGSIRRLRLAVAVGVYLVALRGPAIVVLGLLGLVGGYGYTAPPLQYKYHALGVPIVFLLMGPLMVVGSYFAITGIWATQALVLSIPVGLLVAAILHGNEWRDISEDTRAGIVTLSSRIGRDWAHYGYVALVLGAYMALGLAVAFNLLPPASLLAILSLPLLAQVVRSAELGASGQARAIAMIDLQTARLHLAFGALLVAGILLSGLLRG